MRTLLVLILIVLTMAGCAVTRRAAPPLAAPPQPVATETAPASPEVDLYPGVPRHPAATSHAVEPDQKVSMLIKGAPVGELLAWYETELTARGWLPVQTGHALRFYRDGTYVSMVGHGLANGSVLLRLHQRTTPELTEADARTIASHTHGPIAPDQWRATYVPDYVAGTGTEQPVWMLEVRFPHGRVTVWVDAVTAEPFQIREASDY